MIMTVTAPSIFDNKFTEHIRKRKYYQ